MRIYPNFQASLNECPECGFEQENLVSCRNCQYNAGAELSQQWTDYVEKLDLPPGAEMENGHEGEPDDYWIDLSLNREKLDPRELVKALDALGASCDIEASDVAPLLEDGKHLNAIEEKLIDPLAEILDQEGWGGREDSVPARELLNVVHERIRWLRDMKAEELR